MNRERVHNGQIADVLEHVADLLARNKANRFRIDSYQRAADTVRHTDESIAALCAESDRDKLERMPGIGDKLARSICEIAETGRLRLADRLEAEVVPQELLARVPGIGDKLAERLHQELGINTLEELENAAHDGRLAEYPGIGDKRLAGIRDALAGMLSRSARRRARQRQKAPESSRVKSGTRDDTEPAVATLLDIDDEYRRKAEQDKLKKIAPKRFNPEGTAWLPILHTERGGWSFTALYSNTARAHERGKTNDWVVVYYKRNGAENQCTIITAERGSLTGKRVVRGRERECRLYYEDGR